MHHRIQPPGAWHSVYTPTKGMTTGGHLWMYEALHLTEMSRAYDGSEDEDGVITATPRMKRMLQIDNSFV